jgi:alpha-beta hydrolase superfamily lysophospholipase
MNHQDGIFQGVRDTDITYQCWLPEDEIKAVLVIVHGLAEHSGRYMNVVNHFVPLGYAVYGLDHIGHGRSEGTRVYVERFSDYTQTLKAYVDKIRAWQPDTPLFMVGHSLGGLIASAYLLDHQEDLTGAVLSGPGVKVPDSISPMTVALGKVLSTLMPRTGLVQLDANEISRDPAVVQAYVNDPLVYTGKTTARLAAEMLKTMRRVTEEASAITLPVMIVQGSEDKLVDPAGARMLYETVSSDDKTLKIYNGLYHEVFNEPEHAEVLGDVEAWLDAHMGSA